MEAPVPTKEHCLPERWVGEERTCCKLEKYMHCLEVPFKKHSVGLACLSVKYCSGSYRNEGELFL